MKNASAGMDDRLESEKYRQRKLVQLSVNKDYCLKGWISVEITGCSLSGSMIHSPSLRQL